MGLTFGGQAHCQPEASAKLHLLAELVGAAHQRRVFHNLLAHLLGSPLKLLRKGWSKGWSKSLGKGFSKGLDKVGLMKRPAYHLGLEAELL